MRKKRLYILYFRTCFYALLIAGCSCSGTKVGYYEPGIDELRSAPERVRIGGKEYYIETYLVRDLMPIIDPKDKTGLLTDVKIRTADGTLTDSIRVEHLWIINKDSVWRTKPQWIIANDTNSVEYVSRNGPFWEAGIRVDVVILLNIKNQRKYLKAKDQKINAVY